MIARLVKAIAVLWAVALAIAPTASLHAQVSNPDVVKMTIDGGGKKSSGAGYTVTGTIGQHDADPDAATNGAYNILGGFWRRLPSAGSIILDKTVGADADICATDSTLTVKSGAAAYFCITIHNESNRNVTSGVVSDVIPVGLTFVPGSVVIEPAGAGTLGTPPHLVTGLTLDAGQEVTVTFQTTVNSGLDPGLVITNTASVTTAQVVTPLTDSATVTIAYQEQEITHELTLLNMAITGFDMNPDFPVPPGIVYWEWTIGTDVLESVRDIYFDVVQLRPDGIAVINNADGGPTGEGARVSVDNADLPGGALNLGEQFTQVFEIGWNVYAGFTFQVRAYGVVMGAGSGVAESGQPKPQLLGTYMAEFDPEMVDIDQDNSAEPYRLFLPVIIK